MPQLKKIAKENKFVKKSYRTYDVDAELVTDNQEIRSTQEEQPNRQTFDADKKVYILELDPSQCKPWNYADRDQSEMGDIEQLANSIKANGQQEPALVRRININNSPELRYEVIFGHRRWLACKLANQPLLAMVKDLSDQQAAICQKEENENRENLSDFARAFNYKKLLDNHIFKSERELAANFNVNKSTLADLMSYTKIPDQLLKALKTPHLLPKRSAIKLSQLCKNISDEELKKLCGIANLIITGKIPYKKLNVELLGRDTPILAENNKSKKFKNSLSVPLFTAGQNPNKAPCFTFHKIVTDNNLLHELEELVFNFLKSKTEYSDVE